MDVEGAKGLSWQVEYAYSGFRRVAAADVFSPAQRASGSPIAFLRRTRRLMASVVAWLIGLLFLGVGIWILMLRFEGLVDRISPHNMSIGQMTVDGTES